jgi:hypothetical protein
MNAEQSILSYIKGLIMNLSELKFDLGHPQHISESKAIKNKL